jgi:hypothetical protein
MTVQIRFDDVSSLRAMIKDEYGPWGPELEITQAMIDEFADLTGDRQWIHVDVDRANDGPFGSTIAQGLLTLAMGPRIRTPDAFEVIGHGNLVNYGSDGLRFLEPIRPGDVIHAHSRLTDVVSHAMGTRMQQEIVVHIVDHDRPSVVFSAITLYAPPA